MVSVIDTFWVILATILVFFMQSGFTLVETGLTRSKNSGNIVMKNIMDFAIGALMFWFVGCGIMFGANSSGIIGNIDFFATNTYATNITSTSFVMFQTVFCATAATIVSGAVAERTKFTSYLLISFFITAFVYPISGHWIWGGGFLSTMGFHDFAGSTAVHFVGGVSAIICAKAVGARIGKYKKDGTPKAIPGHNLVLCALGVFILWFCWFGFNGGSILGISEEGNIQKVSNIIITTNIAACSGSIFTMLITWKRYKKPDVSMTLNGALGALVAITAGCDVVSPIGAFFIGLIASVVIVFSIEFIDNFLKIDDPVGAIGVHGFCGFVGTFCVGLFSTKNGLFYGFGFKQLGVQTFGLLVVAAWVAITMFLLTFVIKKTIGLRVTKEEELKGLDIEEHGLENVYADFVQVDKAHELKPIVKTIENVSCKEVSTPANEFTRIVILTKRSKLDELKLALTEIGINGMTVSDVLGYGMQRGMPEYYRGTKIEASLLPKISVEIVVCKVPVDLVVSTAKSVLYTGAIGDGKIFISKVDNIVKIRTGEEGFDALQDD